MPQKNDKFIEFVAKTTQRVFDSADGDLAGLLASGLEAEREALVQEIGENITVRRACLMTSDAGGIASYLHADNRKGALVNLSVNNPQLARDVAMHVVAVAPMVVKSEDVPADVLEKEREIYTTQAQDSGKPEEIIAKMVEGRVRKYLAEVSLVDQEFVKDPDQKVGALVKAAGAEVVEFQRFEVGEGIEKAEEDFAAEVAAQLKG